MVIGGMMNKLSIRTKILLITLFIFSAGLFIGPNALRELVEVRYENRLEEDVDEILEILEENYKKIDDINFSRAGNYFVLIYDNKTKKLIPELSVLPGRYMTMKGFQNIDMIQKSREYKFEKEVSEDGRVTIVVGYSSNFPREIVQPLERDFLFVYIFLALLVISGVMISTTIAFRPIRKTSEQVNNLDPLFKLEKLDEIGSKDEISVLIKTFNTLLEKTYIASKSQKQFVENASHELNTPLTSLKLQIEQLLKKDDVNKETIASIQEDVDEIQSTIEALMALETVTKNDISNEKVNVNAIVEEVINNSDIQFINNEIITVFSNSKILKVMLNNLIGNAEKFKEKEIKITLDQIGKKPSLVVEDDGVGIDSENYDLIFNPFWQEDESRTRNKSGKGLGLSIVKNITLRYGWSISVDKSELGGAKFIITF
jgi:two-component system OmpR family sensor kinase